MAKKIHLYPEVDFMYTSWIFTPSDFPDNWFPEIGETFRVRTSVLNLESGRFEGIADFQTIKITKLARTKNLVGEGFARIAVIESSETELWKEIGLIFRGSIRIWERRKEKHKLERKPIKENP